MLNPSNKQNYYLNIYPDDMYLEYLDDDNIIVGGDFNLDFSNDFSLLKIT